jgi:hypothetical protein
MGSWVVEGAVPKCDESADRTKTPQPAAANCCRFLPLAFVALVDKRFPI